MKGLMKFINERFISFIAWLIINIIGKTSIVKRIEHKKVENLKKKKNPFIYAVWHNRLLFLVYSHRRQDIYVMTSQSEDGEYISQILYRFGFKTIRGSSSRGGKRAFIEMLRKLRGNKIIAITPDGPRGPVNKVQPGIVYLAMKSGYPIIPLTYGMKRKKILSSWDKFIIPFPFNRGVVITGAPIYVGSNDNLQEKTGELEKAMNKITEQADTLVKK
ncbi:lysophospholipid acyltransferase family protein [bacterium]|nr:lysophospholipid acyltransferase family protein [bacterium]